MKLRTYLGLTAVLVATAIPAIGSAQRHSRSNRSVVGGYRRGPFYPSWIPGASQRYVGAGAQIRRGGATVYFSPGGGYYGNYPTYYGYQPYGYALLSGYGYGYRPSYGHNPGNRYRSGNNLYRSHRRR